jgi:SAM-dependent methyltransferase
MTLDTNTTYQSSEEQVYLRYATASQKREQALCCPVEYDLNLLKIIPQEIIERDYGCGDPTPYVKAGDTVLDLGSGGGKLCYIAAQLVGAKGKVIGVDCNLQMLELARKYRSEVAYKLGYSNVDFRYGMIQDLALDLELLSHKLNQAPVNTAHDWLGLRSLESKLRQEQTLIQSDSIDCVISNCVLNLVRQEDRKQLFAEIFRVLKKGGRVAISDIVADEDVPLHLQQNAELWSGCISGSFREDLFIDAFAEAGFHGMELVKRESKPWQTVEGIEFRSVTIIAYKGKQGPCLERNQALIYKGPFMKVEDDDGHVYTRGDRVAVCDKTYNLLQQSPYDNMFYPVDPINPISMEDAQSFNCKRTKLRSPRETKGQDYNVTNSDNSDCCVPGSNCC